MEIIKRKYSNTIKLIDDIEIESTEYYIGNRENIIELYESFRKSFFNGDTSITSVTRVDYDLLGEICILCIETVEYMNSKRTKKNIRIITTDEFLLQMIENRDFGLSIILH